MARAIASFKLQNCGWVEGQTHYGVGPHQKDNLISVLELHCGSTTIADFSVDISRLRVVSSETVYCVDNSFTYCSITLNLSLDVPHEIVVIVMAVRLDFAGMVNILYNLTHRNCEPFNCLEGQRLRTRS